MVESRNVDPGAVHRNPAIVRGWERNRTSRVAYGGGSAAFRNVPVHRCNAPSAHRIYKTMCASPQDAIDGGPQGLVSGREETRDAPRVRI